MNMNFQMLGGSLPIYSKPTVTVLDMKVEGMLCESGISINDWENDDELLDFD